MRSTVKFTRPDLAALIVLGVVVVAIAGCAIARVDVPSILTQLGLLLAGIAGGAAIPSPSTVSSSSTSAAAPPAPVLPPVAAAPQGFARPPAVPAARLDDTGVFPRVATHQ
jgi:hypothetical protein